MRKSIFIVLPASTLAMLLRRAMWPTLAFDPNGPIGLLRPTRTSKERKASLLSTSPRSPDPTPEHSTLAIQIVHFGSPITVIFPVEANIPDSAAAPDMTHDSQDIRALDDSLGQNVVPTVAARRVAAMLELFPVRLSLFATVIVAVFWSWWLWRRSRSLAASSATPTTSAAPTWP